MRDPALRCARAKRDNALVPQVQRIWHANMQVYGIDKVWKQMNRDRVGVARLLWNGGCAGWARAVYAVANSYALLFKTPMQHAREIVGWRQSISMRADFVLDALARAFYERHPGCVGAPIHHSDRGSQHVSIRYSDRLTEVGI